MAAAFDAEAAAAAMASAEQLQQPPAVVLPSTVVAGGGGLDQQQEIVDVFQPWPSTATGSAAGGYVPAGGLLEAQQQADTASLVEAVIASTQRSEQDLMTTTTTTTGPRGWLSGAGGLDEVAKGRLLVVAASAIYGTNFATVKMMDEALPTSAAASLRFAIAAVAVVSAVAWGEARSSGKDAAESGASWEDIEQEVKDRGPATWLGAEVGAWYCVGYLLQAWGLHTVDASKVRDAEKEGS